MFQKNGFANRRVMEIIQVEQKKKEKKLLNKDRLRDF